MDKSPRTATFVPERGLVVGQTIKEQFQALLDHGYFDNAESAILGVSNKTDYDARWAGSRFDCLALVGVVNDELQKEK